MRKIIVEVDKKDSEYLERLNYELGFTKDVVQRIIESHPDEANVIKSESFTAYQKKGAELEAEYKTASAELEKKYVPDELKGHRYSWMLYFNTRKMEITVHCNCKITGVPNEEK